MVSLLGGIFLGWSLGANDAANVFGTAVSSRMLRFSTAAGLAAVLAGKLDTEGKVTAVVLSGGNVDRELFAEIQAEPA